MSEPLELDDDFDDEDDFVDADIVIMLGDDDD